MPQIPELRESVCPRKRVIDKLPPDVRMKVAAIRLELERQWEMDHGHPCPQEISAILDARALDRVFDPTKPHRNAGRKSWKVRKDRGFVIVAGKRKDPHQHLRDISREGVNARRFQRKTGRRYKAGWLTVDGNPAPPKAPGHTAINEAHTEDGKEFN